MQQKWISKIFHILILQVFLLKSNLASLRREVDELDIVKLKSLPTNLSNLKSKIDKLDIIKLETTPVDLSKLSKLVKKWGCEKYWI